MSPAASTSSWGTRPITRSAWDEDVDVSTSTSRYRVLDEDQQKQEAAEVARIINDMKAQRRERHSNSRSRRSSSKREAPVHPIRSSSPLVTDRRERLKSTHQNSERRSFMDVSSSGDQLLPGDEQNPAAGDATSQSFQEQVLSELQKLKETQRLEFEALERLQQEKDAAERKTRRLELKLRHQQRQLSRKEEQTAHSSVRAHTSNRQQDITLLDDADSEEEEYQRYSSNNNVGDTCENDDHDTEEDAPELIEWDDVARPPPPYCAIASPATSPFKRGSGWPSWSAADESLPPECNSLEPKTALTHRPRSRSRNKMDTPSMSRGSSSARLRSSSRSLSRRPSATRTRHSTQDSQELRRSCPFFEDKAREQAEAELRVKEATERLERACHAAPPQKLLERQALAKERRSQQIKELEREMRAELAHENQVKARDVPITTYLSTGDVEEAEQKRKERIRQRAQEMLQASALPPRMEVISKNGTSDNITSSTTKGSAQVGHMSVKLKKKLIAATEEEAERRKRRPKPVPKFDQLHVQWEASMKKRKELARRNQDEENAVHDDTETSSNKKTAEFFTSRAAELADLQARKEARKQRQLAKEEAIRQHAKRAQDKLLERARASRGADIGSQRKPTKAETLRVQKLMAETTKKQKERQREEREANARERRREEAARRVRAQVKQSENVRRDNYAGDFVDLRTLDTLAKEKAREQRQQFKEAIARNREKLLAAAAARPSLMERFTTGVKRETHHRAALEAVVKTVFKKDLSVLKGVLTDDEQELAREMVAADDDDKGKPEDAD